METQTTYFYRRSHFESLLQMQKDSIDALFLYIDGHALSDRPDCDDEHIHENLNIFRPVEGCIPEEEIDDDLTESVRRKFSWLYSAALQWAERELIRKGKRLHEDFSFCLVIDASCTDCTHIVIIDYKTRVLYLHEWTKAWHYQFESMAKVADELLRIKNLLVKKVMEKVEVFVVVQNGNVESVNTPEEWTASITVINHDIEDLEVERLQISPLDGEACVITKF